jgi:hypothetical protein
MYKTYDEESEYDSTSRADERGSKKNYGTD